MGRFLTTAPIRDEARLFSTVDVILIAWIRNSKQEFPRISIERNSYQNKNEKVFDSEYY